MIPEQINWRHFLLLLGAVGLAYANAFQGVFQFDDYNVIVNYQVVHSFAAWWQDLHHGIRPLLKLTYTLDWASNTGTFAFHLFNLLLHLANTVLVWRLTCYLVAAFSALRGQAYLPVLTALIFALHPANTEAVTYICGRSISLMTLFYLLGLWAYETGRVRNSALHLHVVVPLCMALALASKEIAVTFPAALLLWEAFRGGNLRLAWRWQWANWLMLLAGAIYFLTHTGYLYLVKTSLDLNSLSGNAATQLLALVYLLRQWIAPFWLNIDPDLPVLAGFTGLWPHAIMLALYLTLMYYSYRSRPWLAFALLWGLLHLVPLYLVLPRVDVANDRQLYLAGWPLGLALVAELSLRVPQKILKPGLMMLLLLLGALTVLRNQDYRSEIALWQATLQHSPGKARVHNNLGYAYKLAGRHDAARQEFETALRLDPGYFPARYNLSDM